MFYSVRFYIKFFLVCKILGHLTYIFTVSLDICHLTYIYRYCKVTYSHVELIFAFLVDTLIPHKNEPAKY